MLYLIYHYGYFCPSISKQKTGETMKLKNRMVISFFVIILVPLILTGVAVTGFTMYQVWSLEKKYGIEGVTYENLSNNTMLLSKMTQKTFSTLEKTASSDPEKLEETSYLNSLNQDLTGKNAYLLIRKGNDMFYCGSPTQDELLFSELPEYGDPSADNDRGVYIGADVQSLIKQVDFTFTDGVKGSAFIIFHSNSMVPQLKKILLDTVFVIILILILTALGLCTWTYRGVMTPLTQLKEATKNIKEGNLDFTIEKTGVDEIGDLCDDFEEMRKRLKESAEEKVAFDKENKELISNISHDLKTPITAVKGYVEGIMDGVADTPEKMDRYIRTIYNKANEMDRLINELTFYSKIDTNRIPYTFNKIHISDDFEEMRKRLKEPAEEKVAFDKENKELISNISHDLKTPITAVKGYVEGIMDGVADTPEKMDRYIRTIYNKANEMDRLINELTFYSKIDTNRIPYTFNKIHISDYFEDCVDELSVELESSGVSLTYFNYLEEDAVVIADAEQLKRVINNIVSNSLKYMDKPKGVINIRLRDVGDFIQIEIEDNGKGIAQKDLANIFERFYRTDASRNSSKGGSGIGLSIVKKIMEDHGGQVWARSKEGTGTTMYLALRKYQEVPVHE